MLNNISPFPTFQAFNLPLPIIPSKLFTIPFPKVLNKIDGILTKTERKLLCLFERFCFNDGKIFPKQWTLAQKLGITVRQIKRVVASLTKKGFIAVVPSSLVERHLHGKGNNYSMIYNQAYDKMSPEMSPENQDPTLLKKDKVIKTKGGFDVIEFLERNAQAHPSSVVDALKELTKRWPSIKFPDKYAQTVVDIQSGNYNAAEHAAQVKEDTPKIINTMAQVALKIGFSLPSIGQPPKKKKDTPQDRNTMRNALLDMFG